MDGVKFLDIVSRIFCADITVHNTWHVYKQYNATNQFSPVNDSVSEQDNTILPTLCQCLRSMHIILKIIPRNEPT